MPLQRVVDRLPPRARAGVDLAVATVRGAAADRIAGLAAEIAFWVAVSLPPILLVVASAAGLIGRGTGADVRAELIGHIRLLALQVFRPSTVEAAITPTLDSLLESGSPSVLSVSFLVALFSASRVLHVIAHAVTIAYLTEPRSSWRNRLVGLAMTLVMLLVGVVLIPVVVGGPRLGEIVGRRLGLNVNLWLAEIWTYAYWPVLMIVMTLLAAALYHHAVPWRTPFHRELPGAALATVAGLLAGVALRAYTTYAFEAQAVYVSLAAPLAVLLWVWLQAMAILLGAELNAEIEKLAPTVRRKRGRSLSLAALRRRTIGRLRRRRDVTESVTPSSRGPHPRRR